MTKRKVLNSIVFFLAAGIFTCTVRAQELTSTPGWLTSELANLEQAKNLGAKYAIITFSTHRLFWRSNGPATPDAAALDHYRSLVKQAINLGLTPIGAAPTWVLPPFANPPLIPPTEVKLSNGVPLVRISCIPELGSNEYLRLVQIRNEIWAALAREFPQVQLWFVGYEAGLELFDCSGRQLELEKLAPYIAHTLRELKGAIKSANSNATVVAHFLGRSGIPIYLNGKLVQPQEILNAFLAEIDRQGGPRTQYFDLLATALEPSLTIDRSPEKPTAFTFGSSILSGHLDCLKTYCSATAPWREPGWNVKCCEEFTVNTTHLTRDYADWDDISTNPIKTHVVPTEVQGGLAKMKLAVPPLPGPEQDTSIAGGKTAAGVDVVPDQEYDTVGQGPCPGCERKRWTAVMDFYPAVAPGGSGDHAPVFLRVNDRDWIDGVPSQENEIDNQTRFGAFVYKGPITFGPCNNQPCGALEVIGDDLTKPPVGSAGLGQLFTFTLGEAPWSSPTHLYRVQILEREWFHPLSFLWELQWRAEAQDLTDAQVWTGDWVSEWTIKNVYHIDIPLLPGSKLLFGFGTGITGGEAHAERTGTSYWRY